MEPITSDTILILAGSFLCVFISLVSVGGTFLYWRTQQLKNSPLPEPTPPPVTRDVHAKPLGETPTRDESFEPAPQAAEPERRNPMVTPPQRPLGTEPHPASPTETIERQLMRPLGTDEPMDEPSDGSETVTRGIERTVVTHIELPTKADNDNTPTVIINRNQPIIDDEDKP